jgi:hypothetical protein
MRCASQCSKRSIGGFMAGQDFPGVAARLASISKVLLRNRIFC